MAALTMTVMMNFFIMVSPYKEAPAEDPPGPSTHTQLLRGGFLFGGGPLTPPQRRLLRLGFRGGLLLRRLRRGRGGLVILKLVEDLLVFALGLPPIHLAGLLDPGVTQLDAHRRGGEVECLGQRLDVVRIALGLFRFGCPLDRLLGHCVTSSLIGPARLPRPMFSGISHL